MSQAELHRAPSSLLAEAWAASTQNAVVKLDAWPDRDLKVFEVHLDTPITVCFYFGFESRTRSTLQVVLGSLRQQLCAPDQTVSKVAILRALEYFAIPQLLWPVGIMLVRKARLSMQPVAQDIVSQICGLLSSCSSSPLIMLDKSQADVVYRRSFLVIGLSSQFDKYQIAEYRSHQSHGLAAQKCSLLPAALQTATTEAGKAHALDICCVQDTKGDSKRVTNQVLIVTVTCT